MGVVPSRPGLYGRNATRPLSLRLRRSLEDAVSGWHHTHIVLEPLHLMARLAALVPPPRMHLTRYHGVFAPHSKLRAAVTPAGRGKGKKPQKKRAPTRPPRHAMWR